MKVLLDSNVWRYLADQDAGDSLRDCVKGRNIEILVAPALVFEARELLNDPVRKSILQLLATPEWTRLMPEAFLEAMEIKAIIRRHRPEWLINSPDMTKVDELEKDWVSCDGGFWARAAADIKPTQTNESLRHENEHRLAQQKSREIRARVKGRGDLLPDISIRDVYGVPPATIPGWLGEPVEYWRVPSLHVIWNEIQIYSSPYREWIDSEINVDAILEKPDRFNQLWYYEISAIETKRQWLRGAFEYLQAYHKVTTGNPVDSQLSSHLVDTDIIVSADRNFVRFVEKCKNDAPFEVAEPRRVSGGENGVDELLAMLSAIPD